MNHNQFTGLKNFRNRHLDIGGVYTTIDVPGSTYTVATGINDMGEVFGFYRDSSGDLSGFVENGGVLTTIDPPGSTNAVVGGVNDLGQIVGGYGPSGHISGGFLAVPLTPTLTTLVSFNGANGANGAFPYAGLITDAAGDLFGTTVEGGAYGNGAVFELVNNGGGAYTPVTLLSFTGNDGAEPFAGLIADAAGDLFGTTASGGAPYNRGTVFELVNHGGGAYTPVTLLSFTNGNPESGLIADAAGDLFGTTYYGGTYNIGAVFELVNSGGGAYTPVTLLSFNGTNGANPSAGLIADAAGDLFGTTAEGGADGDGAVFELVNHGGGAYTPVALLSFNGANGANPSAGLIADAAGDLFGTTTSGGAYGNGTVFELVNHGGGAYTPVTLLSFNGTNGAGPYSGLIADAAGDLFGTTAGGGAAGDGTVFELVNHGGGAYTPVTLLSFNGANGTHPYSGLIADAAGDLFGTTHSGGPADGVGTVFEITDSGFIVALPTVQPDSAHVPVAGTVSATAANGVLANDTDPIPNDTLSVSAVDGQASNVGNALTGSYGTLTLDADGSFSYVADQSVPSNIIAQDIFTYTATEEAGGSATSTLTITVTQPGQAYIAGTPGQALTSGNGSVLLDGSLLQNETISAGNGNDGVIAGPNDTITLGNGIDVVKAGDNETITLGNGVDTVTAGANSIVTLGNGADNVTTGSYTTIKLGNGADTVTAGDNALILLGNGADNATAGLDSTIKLGNGGDTVMAGANSIVTVGNGNDTVTVGANSTVTLGNGADTVTAISSLIDGGNGHDSFVCTGSFGLDTIANFGPQHDNIVLAQAMFANFAAVQSHMAQVGSNTVITYDPADVITLTGVKTSSLLASDFHFV